MPVPVCLLDGAEHRRKNLVAVLQDDIGVPFADRRIDELRDVVRECRIPNESRRAHVEGGRILGDKERNRHADGEDQHHRGPFPAHNSGSHVHRSLAIRGHQRNPCAAKRGRTPFSPKPAIDGNSAKKGVRPLFVWHASCLVLPRGSHMLRIYRTPTARAAVLAVAVLTSVSIVAGQTPISAPPNKYSPAEDVQLGRQAARQAEEQLPILRDDDVTSYTDRIGDRLVSRIPAEFEHPEFRYSFKVVNVREINAFALPGGPLYVNRGMIEAAKTEGEIASVIAHEVSHVALRHGTAQASKATKYQIGELAGAVLGAIIGGAAGKIVSAGTSFGLGTAFMRFSREYERQADLLGAQIMARAGYDPRDMATMFRTIERQSGSGGPEFLSDHPNPSNRYEYITKEAQMLEVRNPIRDSSAFQNVQARLRRMPRASTSTTAEAVRQTGRQPRGSSSDDVGLGRVDPPSSRYRTYTEGDLFRVSVPSNWRELPSGDSVTFAPDGAYGQIGGRSVFTHGIEFGVARTGARNLRAASDELIRSLRQSNPDLRQAGSYRNGSIDGLRALRTQLVNTSDATGREERIDMFTVMLNDGRLFYAIGVAPRENFSAYQQLFARIMESIQFQGS